MELQEFSDYFWAYQNKNIISLKDINIDNRDFCEMVCFDFYRMYMQSNIDIDVICKIAENVFFAIKRYNPQLGY